MKETKIGEEVDALRAGLDAYDRSRETRTLAELQARIEELRGQYRRDPASMAPHTEELRSLSQEVQQRLVARQDELAREYSAVNAEVAELEHARASLRAALVEICRLRGGERIALGPVRAIRFLSLKVPAPNSRQRQELEQLLKERNLYDAYVTLSTAKLQSAIQKELIPAPVLEELRTYCDVSPSYRLTAASVAAPSSLEEMLGPDPQEG